MADPANPFGDFEKDFENVKKADPAATPGRVPPETYKFVLCAQELVEGDGVMRDHEVFVAKNTGTKGFKLFCEILEPTEVPNPKTGEPHVTKGVVLEHVFWVTEKNLPYLKRDIATILERDDFKLSELTTINWAGRTFEGVVRDEKDQGGYVRSRIAFINAWVPGKDAKKDEKKGADAKKDEKKKDESKGSSSGSPAKGADQKKPATSGAKGGDVDF